MTTTILSTSVIDQPAAAGIQLAAEPQRRRTMLDLLNEASGKYWHDAADRLARWTEERLVNRTDVYRTYLAMCHRSAGRCFIFTHPYREGEREPGALNREIIAKHYRDKEHSDLIGVHAVSTSNTCKWFLIDLDEHGHTWHSVNEAANKRAAVGWKERLEQIGFRPLMLDPNGAGGCQLLVCLSEPVSAGLVHAFVTGFVQDYASYGLTRLPNVCPNEPEINTYRRVGSWWRLPGLHHTREHWTRVWSGDRWLDHAEAIEADPERYRRFARVDSGRAGPLPRRLRKEARGRLCAARQLPAKGRLRPTAGRGSCRSLGRGSIRASAEGRAHSSDSSRHR